MRRVSLPEHHESVPIPAGSRVRRFLAFSGPAFLVSVGYMDPGNWATDLAAGSLHGMRLLWVVLLANAMAVLLQTLSARLGIATALDLAQATRLRYPRPVALALWILCEIAIAACDLAEVLGSAIGLNLLFGIPLLAGVVLTAFDVLLLLALGGRSIRRTEGLIIGLVGIVGACFALEMLLARPDPRAVLAGLAPSALGGDALYLAIGILGATVMPHNLYLHSALVQSRRIRATADGRRDACRANLLDTFIALNGAFFVNAAILVLAATVFHPNGVGEVASLEEAHRLLAPLLGAPLAATAFAVALLAAGQSSTLTGTLAGQIVMEGFVDVRLRPWLRRLVTRLIAIVPAVLVIGTQGEAAAGRLLVLSQVILSLQLPFAVVPLLAATSDRIWMGRFTTPRPVRALAWSVAAGIFLLNGALVVETLSAGLAAGDPWTRWALLPATLALVPLLGWMLFVAPRRTAPRLPPRSHRLPTVRRVPEAAPEKPAAVRRIGVCLELSPRDAPLLARARELARAEPTEVVLLHALESMAGRVLGEEADDLEARADAAGLSAHAARLRAEGLSCRTRIGSGEAEDILARLAEEERLDLLVAGSHGHGLLGDLLHGSTVSELRHRTCVPILTVRV